MDMKFSAVPICKACSLKLKSCLRSIMRIKRKMSFLKRSSLQLFRSSIKKQQLILFKDKMMKLGRGWQRVWRLQRAMISIPKLCIMSQKECGKMETRKQNWRMRKMITLCKVKCSRLKCLGCQRHREHQGGCLTAERALQKRCRASER